MPTAIWAWDGWVFSLASSLVMSQTSTCAAHLKVAQRVLLLSKVIRKAQSLARRSIFLGLGLLPVDSRSFWGRNPKPKELHESNAHKSWWEHLEAGFVLVSEDVNWIIGSG